MTNDIVVRYRCKAFSSESNRLYKLRVDSENKVTVYDSVAGYYTGCHSLSRYMIKKIIRMVRGI